MRLTLRFDFYSVADLAEMVRHRSRALFWQVDEEVFRQIAQRSRGTPRLALRLLQSCHRVCRAAGDKEITVEHLFGLVTWSRSTSLVLVQPNSDTFRCSPKDQFD